MKSRCFKMIHFAVIALMSINMIACDNARFSNDALKAAKDGENGTNAIAEDIVFLDDSFERSDIFIDLMNSIIYGWRGFIDDGGTNVLGFEGNNTGMKIFDQNQLGPAFEGTRALYMFGREGADIQTMYLVSQAYDLSDYNSVILNFRYLTIALNDATDSVPEYLRLQVCKAADLNACGANADILDGNALKNEANWVTVFEKVPGAEDDSRNGKNHVLNNWETALAVIDLNDPAYVGDKSQFVFRIVGRMRDGFTVATTTPGQGDCDCKDKDHKNHKDCKDKHKHDCDHKNDCKDKNCKHKNCKNKNCKDKHCKEKHQNVKKDCCKCKCENGGGVVVPADGTLKDGIGIDKIMGIATQRSIGDIF